MHCLNACSQLISALTFNGHTLIQFVPKYFLEHFIVEVYSYELLYYPHRKLTLYKWTLCIIASKECIF